ncbi:MAG TPA: A24 family peptidase, partial [Chthonomonadales bacterium]|nr:A24 family peptidase [Chthonomonadales bacterium]
AAAIVLVIRWTYWLIRRQEGMGLGDAKLMAMMAAWLGLEGAVLSFVLGVCAAAAFSLVVLAQPRARRGAKSWATTALPFGTFLCMAAVVTALWGGQMIDAYLRWSGLR